MKFKKCSMKKKKYYFFMALIAIGVIYFGMTPHGALRLSVALHGYPVEAVLSTIEDKEYDFYTEDNQIGYTLSNPPITRISKEKLDNWVVSRYGIFYIGDYYGEG